LSTDLGLAVFAVQSLLLASIVALMFISYLYGRYDVTEEALRALIVAIIVFFASTTLRTVVNVALKL